MAYRAILGSLRFKAWMRNVMRLKQIFAIAVFVPLYAPQQLIRTDYLFYTAQVLHAFS